MLPYAFLLMFLFVGSSMANVAAGKWQLLFFYQVYQYQADALGLANGEMAVDCSKNGAVCDLKSFVKLVGSTARKPIKDANNKIVQPIRFNWTVDFDSVDWDSIGDGNTFSKEKFSSEMDGIGFKGTVWKDKVFNNEVVESFAGVMDEAERIVEKAQAQLNSKGYPISNDRYTALQDALDIHADARRADQATKVVETFTKWASGRGYTVKLGDTIMRPYAPSYQKIDAAATTSENALTGDKAQVVRDFVQTNNAAGHSAAYVGAISRASSMQKKFAATCK